MINRYDLIIAGAGPCGLTLAWRARESGLKVLVFDKKKESGNIAYNTAGGFIDLKQWDIPEDVAHPITRLYFASKNASIERGGKACMINRRLLLTELEEKCIEAGVEIRYNTYAKNIDVRDEMITCISLSDNDVIEAFVYADCSALGHVFNKKLPVYERRPVTAVGYEYVVPLKTDPDLVELYLGSSFKGGYGWLSPLSDDKAIVGCGTLIREDFPKVKEMLDEMMRTERVKKRVDAKPIEAHAGVFNTGSPLKKFHKNNLIIVGDVALQGNPVIGEGVRFVMDAADMASKAVAEAVSNDDLGLLRNYSDAWVRKYYNMFKTGYLIQKWLVWLTQRDEILDKLVRIGDKAGDKTLMTLFRGEADYAFMLKKLPKLLYKPFT